MKFQAQDTDASQALSFGEILRAKEKQLEREINVSSAIVALAAMQTSVMTVPMLDPSVTEEIYKTDIRPALEKGLPRQLSPRQSSIAGHSQVEKNLGTGLTEIQKAEVNADPSVVVSIPAPTSVRPAQKPEVPVSGEVVLTQNLPTQTSPSPSDSSPTFNAGTPDGQNNHSSSISDVSRTQNIPLEGVHVAVPTGASPEASALRADTHLNQTAKAATQPTKLNAHTEVTQREMPRQVAPQPLPEHTAKPLEANIVQTEMGEPQVSTGKPIIEVPSPSIPVTTPENHENLPAEVETKQTKLVVEAKTEDVDTNVSLNGLPQHADNTVWTAETLLPEAFRTLPSNVPVEMPARSDLGNALTASITPRETLSAPWIGLKPEAVLSQGPNQKKTVPGVKTTSSSSSGQPRSETLKVTTQRQPSSDFVSVEEAVTPGQPSIATVADSFTNDQISETQVVEEQNPLLVWEIDTYSSQSVKPAGTAQTSMDGGEYTAEMQKAEPRSEMALGTEIAHEALPRNVKTPISQIANKNVHIAHPADKTFTQVDFNIETPSTTLTDDLPAPAQQDTVYGTEVVEKQANTAVLYSAPSESVVIAFPAEQVPSVPKKLADPLSASSKDGIVEVKNATPQTGTVTPIVGNPQPNPGEPVVTMNSAEVQSVRRSVETPMQAVVEPILPHKEFKRENVVIETEVDAPANEDISRASFGEPFTPSVNATEAPSSRSVRQSQLSAQEANTSVQQSATNSVVSKTTRNQDEINAEMTQPERQGSVTFETVVSNISVTGANADPEVDPVGTETIFKREIPIVASVETPSGELLIEDDGNDAKRIDAVKTEKPVKASVQFAENQHFVEPSTKASIDEPKVRQVLLHVDQKSQPLQTPNAQQGQIKAERHTNTPVADQSVETEPQDSVYGDAVEPGLNSQSTDSEARATEKPADPAKPAVANKQFMVQELESTSNLANDAQIHNELKRSDQAHSEMSAKASVPVETKDLHDLKSIKSGATNRETQQFAPETDKSGSPIGNPQPHPERPSVAKISSGTYSSYGTVEIKVQTIDQAEESWILLDQPEFNSGFVQKSIEQETAGSDPDVMASLSKNSGTANQVPQSKTNVINTDKVTLQDSAIQTTPLHSDADAQHNQGFESLQNLSSDKEIAVSQATIPVIEFEQNAEEVIRPQGTATAENEISRQSAIETKITQAALSHSEPDTQQNQDAESPKNVSFDGEVLKPQSSVPSVELPRSKVDETNKSETDVVGKDPEISHRSIVQPNELETTELQSETANPGAQPRARQETTYFKHRNVEINASLFETASEVTQAESDASAMTFSRRSINNSAEHVATETIVQDASPATAKSDLPKVAPFQKQGDLETPAVASQRIDRQVVDHEPVTETSQAVSDNPIPSFSAETNLDVPVATSMQVEIVQERSTGAMETVEKPVSVAKVVIEEWQHDPNTMNTANIASFSGNENQMEDVRPQPVVSAKTASTKPNMDIVKEEVAPSHAEAGLKKSVAEPQHVERQVHVNEFVVETSKSAANHSMTASSTTINAEPESAQTQAAAQTTSPEATNLDLPEDTPLHTIPERKTVNPDNVAKLVRADELVVEGWQPDSNVMNTAKTADFSGNENQVEGMTPQPVAQDASSGDIKSDLPKAVPPQAEVPLERSVAEPHQVKKQVRVKELFAETSEPADHPRTSSLSWVEAETEGARTPAPSTPLAATNSDVREAGPAQIDTDSEQQIVGNKNPENQITAKNSTVNLSKADFDASSSLAPSFEETDREAKSVKAQNGPHGSYFQTDMNQEGLIVNPKNIEKRISVSESTVNISQADSDILATVTSSQTVNVGEPESVRSQTTTQTIQPDQSDMQEANSFRAETGTHRQIVAHQSTEKQIEADESVEASHIHSVFSETFVDGEAQPTRAQTVTQTTSSTSVNPDVSDAVPFVTEVEPQKSVVDSRNVENQANTTTTANSQVNVKPAEKVDFDITTRSNVETNPQRGISGIAVQEFADVSTVERKEPQNREVSVQASPVEDTLSHVSFKSEAFTEEDPGEQDLRADQTHLTDEKIRPVEKEYGPNELYESASVPTNSHKGIVVMGPVEKGPAVPVNLHAVEVVQQVIRQLNGRLKSGSTSMHLQLNPEALGAIEVEMVRDAQGISVTFFAEQASTGKLLETQLSQLRQSLVDSGVQLSGLNIGQHSHIGQEGGFQQQNTNFAQTSQRETFQREVNATESPHVERVTGQTSEVDYLI